MCILTNFIVHSMFTVIYEPLSPFDEADHSWSVNAAWHCECERRRFIITL